ncbi:hypothetical protein [Saccharothrix xinjiangensis]|uniref:Uncharacterized protein n=1 Tax=Saccharothrix xinjiangensis TaxID=204798 RepID=A0ABV9XTS9_9PSEU
MLSLAVRIVLGLHAIVLGAGYAMGPSQWYSAGTFTVVRSLGAPIPLWGAVFILAGALLLALRRSAIGHVVALMAFVFWGLALAASLPAGQLSGWGSLVHNLVLAAPLHALGVWRRAQARVDARVGRT